MSNSLNQPLPEKKAKQKLKRTTDQKLVVVVNNIENSNRQTEREIHKEEKEQDEIQDWNLPIQPASYMKFPDHDHF